MLITTLTALIIALIVMALVFAALRYVPLPDPFHWLIPAVMLLILALILLYTLFPLAGVRP